MADRETTMNVLRSLAATPGNQATMDDMLAARQRAGYQSNATMRPVGAGNTMTTQHYKQPGPAEAALSLSLIHI